MRCGIRASVIKARAYARQFGTGATKPILLIAPQGKEIPAFSLGSARCLITKCHFLIPSGNQDRDHFKGGWRSISTSWGSGTDRAPPHYPL